MEGTLPQLNLTGPEHRQWMSIKLDKCLFSVSLLCTNGRSSGTTNARAFGFDVIETTNRTAGRAYTSKQTLTTEVLAQVASQHACPTTNQPRDGASSSSINSLLH